jgi:hypothetical protein
MEEILSWEKDEILVKRLVQLYDAWDALGIPRVESVVGWRRTSSFSPRFSYHYGGVRYFQTRYEKRLEVDPIEIDNSCNGGRVQPLPVVIDGHHRLLGALLAGQEKIECYYSGRVDVLEYLKGECESCPEE